MRIGQRVRAVHLSQYCPGGLGFAAGSPADPGYAECGPMQAWPGPDAAGAACARCAEEITAAEPARRRLNGDWIHEACHPRQRLA